jgi:hypothetical protein
VKAEKEGQPMKARSVRDAKAWAGETFGEVELGDPRRRDRVVQVAAAMAEHPAGALPTHRGDRSAWQAAHRWFITEAISVEQWQQTREQGRERTQVFLVQDPTDRNDSKHSKTKGWGPIGCSTKAQGFFLQAVLAVDAHTAEILGLASEEPAVRQAVPAGETYARRLSRDRESLVWERAIQAIGFSTTPGQWLALQPGERRRPQHDSLPARGQRASGVPGSLSRVPAHSTAIA